MARRRPREQRGPAPTSASTQVPRHLARARRVPPGAARRRRLRLRRPRRSRPGGVPAPAHRAARAPNPRRRSRSSPTPEYAARPSPPSPPARAVPRRGAQYRGPAGLQNARAAAPRARMCPRPRTTRAERRARRPRAPRAPPRTPSFFADDKGGNRRRQREAAEALEFRRIRNRLYSAPRATGATAFGAIGVPNRASRRSESGPAPGEYEPDETDASRKRRASKSVGEHRAGYHTRRARAACSGAPARRHARAGRV